MTGEGDVELIPQRRCWLRLLTLIMLTVVLGCRHSSEPEARTAAPDRDGLPERERFAANDDLLVSLRLSKDVVHVGEAPTMTARFENTGTVALLLNPRLVGAAYQEGTAPDSACTSNADYIVRTLTREDFVQLPPSASWEAQLSMDLTGSPAGPAAALALSPGEYRIAFRYTNYPDCLFTRYDPYAIGAGVWEGQIHANPVTLTVTALEPSHERAVIKRLEDGSASDEDIVLVALQGSQPALDALLKDFATRKAHRTSIVSALRRSPHPDASRRVLEEAMKVEGDGVEWFLLAILVQERARCDSWPPLAALLEASGADRTHEVGDAVAALASRCPTVSEQLRATSEDAERSERSRGRAAALLGWVGTEADVPLLIQLLDEPGLPVARAQAVAALGKIGGDRARAALLAALDDAAYRPHHSSIVAALTRQGGRDVESALIRHLDSRDPLLVVRILIALDQMKAHGAVGDVVALLKHQNPTLRLYAASFLERNADASIAPQMRLAVADKDDGVRARALRYLARHADAASLQTFEQYVASTKQGDREGAIAGLRGVGTSGSVRAIRPLIDTGPASVRSYAVLALEELTFRTWGAIHRSEPVNPGEIDAWLEQQHERTRRDWALDALEREAGVDPASQFARRVEKQRAIDYLDGLRDTLLLPVFERSARGEDYSVRIRAAEAIAAFDAPRARRLLVREFEGRLVAACSQSHRSLERLTGRSFPIDCENSRARLGARAAWAEISTSRPKNDLPSDHPGGVARQAVGV
jgi:HEAT repeat protein